MPVHLSVPSSSENKLYKGVVVAPHVPRTEGGLYWGYSVRLASCLSKFPMLMTPASPSPNIFSKLICNILESLESNCFSFSPAKLCKNPGLALLLLLYPYCCRFVNAGAVFTESPYEEGYDVTIGTSERGSSMDQTTLPPFK